VLQSKDNIMRIIYVEVFFDRLLLVKKKDHLIFLNHVCAFLFTQFLTIQIKKLKIK